MSDFRTVRGMRDLMGPEIRIRDYLMTTAVQVFKQFGYEPLDSPVLELWETLSAKGGEEVEADTFKFKDKGDREVGLRFDLTVPLARIVASNPNLPKPFKRYALGKAWRYDRPQAGRYREFEQADVDVIGSQSPIADAEVVLVALEFFRRVLGEQYKMLVNNRKVLKGLVEKTGISDELAFDCFRAIDKIDKIGKQGVLDELKERGIGASESNILLDAIELKGNGSEILEEFREVLQGSEIGVEGVDELLVMAEIFEEADLREETEFDMSLARGLDYYTGPVYETRYLGKPKVGAIAGGGRYDHLVERFGGPSTPATGISLGIGRLIDVLLARGFSESLVTRLDVYVMPIKKSMVKYAMRIGNELVKQGVTCEIDLMNRTLKKLFAQADSKNTRLAVIIGPTDIENGEVSVRDMITKETELVKLESLSKYVKDILGQ
ncbi:MAG: histidine--tRNA ligase [Candidatus Thorarchaeota archaeon]